MGWGGGCKIGADFFFDITFYYSWPFKRRDSITLLKRNDFKNSLRKINFGYWGKIIAESSFKGVCQGKNP